MTAGADMPTGLWLVMRHASFSRSAARRDVFGGHPPKMTCQGCHCISLCDIFDGESVLPAAPPLPTCSLSMRAASTSVFVVMPLMLSFRSLLSFLMSPFNFAYPLANMSRLLELRLGVCASITIAI